MCLKPKLFIFGQSGGGLESLWVFIAVCDSIDLPYLYALVTIVIGTESGKQSKMSCCQRNSNRREIFTCSGETCPGDWELRKTEELTVVSTGQEMRREFPNRGERKEN